MLNVLAVIGTRPEAIKMAPVLAELARFPERVCARVCVTSQHREMLGPALDLFDIRADYDLDAMQPDQSLSALTATLLTRLDAVVDAARPDWILAQGDTTSVLVAALTGYYRRVPFGHVEAGLRTGDPERPFPEEVNRWIADGLAALLFAPTARSRETLLREGRAPDRIVVTGNTVVDALLAVAERPYAWSAGPLATVPADRPLVLVTAHRRESFGEGLRRICLAVRDVATALAREGAVVVYPVHLNPNVQRPVTEILAGTANVRLLPPLDYASLVQLMKRARLVLTDSGGIQEEAPTFRVPVLVMREKTERPEGIEAGVARLVGTDRARIVAETTRLFTDAAARAAMATGVNPYGDGKAAARIVAALLARAGAGP